MYDWNKFDKWKRIEEQNVTSLNLETTHTFNCVFDHVIHRLEDVTRNLFDINLRDVEIPQADPSWTRTNYTPKQLLDSSYLPRAVAMYNIDVNQDPLVSIPSMDRFNRANIGMTYECCTIKQPRLRMPDGRWFDYVKDIDFSLVATPKYQVASIFWSVLVNEYPLALELVKQFKFHFPLNEVNPIYNGFIQMDDKFKTRIPKPYLVEAFIPRKTVDSMSNMFQINDNMLLADILKLHSHNRIEYKINSGVADETYADLAVSYPCPIYLSANSIDLIENTEGNLKYFGVKIEFLVNYMDLSTFRLSHSMIAINKDNPLLQVPPREAWTSGNYAPVYEANFTQLINETTIWDYYKLEYTEDDVDYVESDNKVKQVTVVNMKGLAEDVVLNAYIDYIRHSNCNLNRSNYFNVEVKRTKRKPTDKWVVGTEDGIELNYDKFNIVDYKGKVGESVYIAIYINKEHFNKWATKRGYLTQQNLTSLIK